MSLQQDIQKWQKAGYASATVTILEAPLLVSARVIEKCTIHEISEELIKSIVADYAPATYMGSSCDDDGWLVFTFVSKR